MNSSVSLRRSQSPLLGPEAQRLLFRILSCFGELEWARLRRPRRMVLAQRVALPGRRHQDPPQMRMPLEGDAEHVPDFALVPVRGRPEIRHGGERRARRR